MPPPPPLGAVWETAGRGLGDGWETAGRGLEGVWETSGSRLGEVWGTSGRRLGDVWAHTGGRSWRRRRAQVRRAVVVVGRGGAAGGVAPGSQRFPQEGSLQLSRVGASARQGRRSFRFTPIPAGGLLVINKMIFLAGHPHRERSPRLMLAVALACRSKKGAARDPGT